MNEVKNIVVIGASAGGINSVSSLLSGLSVNIDAALFVVIHLGINSQPSVIIDIFKRYTDLDCRVASNNLKFENHAVYLAPVNHQLLIEKKVMKVRKGAPENHYRPSIDVLFRSAAAAYSCCVTGIILSGMLDDGASGMSTIKKNGGVCMVQDPQEAQFPDMPVNVLQTIQVDYTTGIDQMAKLLNERFAVAQASD